MKQLFKGKLAKAMSGTLFFTVIEAGMGFLTAVLLGRLLGTDNYGIYSYAMALAGIFTIFNLAGQDRYSVREIAKFHTNGDIKSIAQHVMGVISKVLLLSACIVVTAILLLKILPITVSTDKYISLIIALAVVVATVLMRLYMAFFQGIQKVITSIYPDRLIRPMSFFLIILALYYVSDNKASATSAMLANVTAATIALIVIIMLWSQKKPYIEKTIFNKTLLYKDWRPALPFALLAGIAVINSNIDVIMLGFYVPDADIGIYRITARVATLVAFALTAVNAAFGPNISALFEKSNFKKLQENASKAALAAMCIALPCFFLFSFAGYWVLWLFGEDFTRGTDLLTILSLGQLGNACSGAVGLLLMMTKYAKRAANSLLLSVLFNIIMNTALIPIYGVLGAAIATTTSMILLNLINIYWVWKYLRINPTVLGFVFKKY